jgi:lysophospholipase L1-like esterase
MPLGDSLTAQWEARQFLYDKLTAAGYDFEFVGSLGTSPLLHEGHSGFTIGPDQSEPGNLADNIGRWIPDAQPDIILLLIGNNDYNGKKGVDPAKAPERMAELLQRITALAPKATVLVASVLKIGFVDDYAGELNRALPDIVARQKSAGSRIVFLDLHREVDLRKGAPPYNGPDSDYLDGTHLNASGARKLADGWFTHLQPLLTAKP